MKRVICLLLFTLTLLSFTGCQPISPSDPEESKGIGDETVINYAGGLRIFVATDIHYHYKNADSDEDKVNQYGYTGNERMSLLVQDVLAENEKATLDMVLILGDLGGNNYTIRPYMNADNTEVDASYYGSDDDTIYQVKTRYLDQIMDAGIPVYCLPGNHDTYPADMWEKLFGYKKDYAVEIPEYDTCILMLDLYGLESTNPFFVNKRETLSCRTSRTDEELANLNLAFETAEKYGHVIVCAHNSYADPVLKEYLQNCENIDCMLVGDGHSVKDLTGHSPVTAPTFMMGKYAYCISESAKVQNGCGEAYVYCTATNSGWDYADPTKIDTRSSTYAGYAYRLATDAEKEDAGIKKVYMFTPEEALDYYKWNYGILEADKAGNFLRGTIVYPEREYYGVSQKTGHLLTPHYGMFPSVDGSWLQEYEEEILFDFGK